MKYKYYKGPPLNRGGSLPFYSEINSVVADALFVESCELYEWMYGKDKWKLDPSTYSPSKNWDVIKEEFPFISLCYLMFVKLFL